MLKLKNLKKAENLFFVYRYDIFAIVLIVVAIFMYFESLFQPGQIVFSDIDFPFNSKTYLDEIYGLWNGKWNTTSMLNIPRLFIVLPSYLMSKLLQDNGSVFLKAFILQQSLISAFSIYLFGKRLVAVYYGKVFNLSKILALIFGSLLYALNPYFIYRIQHIYLLVGYSFFPLVILYFLKIFDHKFQKLIIPGYSPLSDKIYWENYRDIYILAILVSLSSAAIHYFFYSIITLGIIFILLILKYMLFKNQQVYNYRLNVIKAILKKLTVFVIVFVTFAFYWLSIYIGSILVGAEASQHNINEIDTYTMFSRQSDIIHVAYLDSYWWKMIDNFKGFGFYIGGGIIIIVILIGAITHFKRHHVVSLLTILGGIMLLLATGVNYPIVTNIFLFLCNLPFFGNVFRDPNKLIGLLAVPYSILFIFGIESLVQLIKHRRVLKLLLFVAMGLSCLMYLLPMKLLFVDEYYHPIQAPEAYGELREEFEESDRYAVYLPTAEQMLRPIHNIATPRWNTTATLKTKATGDVHIYNSPIQTLFHHEGNDPGITYYLNYLQYLLDTGRTQYLSAYIKAFGADTFIYHDEYLEQEQRQKFNLEMINRQVEMETLYKNDIFSVYNINQTKPPLEFKIWSPYGLSHLETFNDLPDYDIQKNPTIFISQSKDNFYEQIQKGDYLEAKTFDDLFLESLDDRFKLYPFDWVDELNPFMKWSKTYLGNPDWTWFMKQINNKSRQFEFDQGKGVAVTFASGKLNIQPHLREGAEGHLVIDFDTMIRTDTFFEADTPALYEVQANPLINLSSVGVVRGVLSQGDPKDIWQVAKSKLIPATENTPYVYNILVSGRHVNKLHVKVRYFDANRKEVGIQYVVAPDEVIDFEAIDFIGETISPKDTKYMRLDLLSFQKPEIKSYWWIHDVNIYDYSAYKVENTIKSVYHANTSEIYDVYVKAFLSPFSGQVDINIGSEKFVLNTKDALYGFRWIKLGGVQLLSGQHQISIQNIEGFNSINQLVVLAKSQERQLKIPLEKHIENTNQMVTFEGENDFYVTGNIQTERFNPYFSYGKGLAIKEGVATQKFEVIKSDNYTIQSQFSFSHLEDDVVIKILDDMDKQVFETTISPSKEVKEKVTINYIPLSPNYIYEQVERGTTRYENQNDAVSIYLEKGMYSVYIEFASHVKNYSPVNALKKFDGNSLLVKTTLESPYYQECSPCESITMDMFYHKLMGDELTIYYEPTCSCDWYIYSSERIPVTAHEELRVAFNAISENVEKRHSKLVYVDQFDHVVETVFIFEVEESKKSNWQSYEQLSLVPEGATHVMLQFWTRGDKEKDGYLSINNLSLEKYDDYTILDNLLIYSQSVFNETTISQADFSLNLDMKKTVLVENYQTPFVWNSYLSPSALWRMNKKTYDIILNGVTMGYELKNTENSLRPILSRLYQIGLVLHGLAFIMPLVFLRILRRSKR